MTGLQNGNDRWFSKQVKIRLSPILSPSLAWEFSPFPSYFPINLSNKNYELPCPHLASNIDSLVSEVMHTKQ